MGKSPFPVSPIGTGIGAGESQPPPWCGWPGRGAWRGPPRAQGHHSWPLFSPPPRGPWPQLLPRYSRFVHQLPHLPHVQHRVPRGPGRRLPLLLPREPGTLPCRGRSRLGLCRRPPPRTPQVSSFSCHSRGAAGDTSRRGGRGAAWSGSGRLSARCARGIPGLVVLSLRTKRSRLR